MTIPQHYIERGAEAWVEMPLADMHPEDAQNARDTAQAVLEAVAADIWQTGYNFGSSDEITRTLGIITDNQRTPNPYRIEHA